MTEHAEASSAKKVAPDDHSVDHSHKKHNEVSYGIECNKRAPTELLNLCLKPIQHSHDKRTEIALPAKAIMTNGRPDAKE